MSTKTNSRGFTLTELIVVIAVTATLAVLLLPTWANLGGHAQAARCLSNLRQLTAAWQAYTSDNRGKLVRNGNESEQPTSLHDPSALPGGAASQWCPGRQDSATQLSQTNATVNVGDEWIELGLIYPYVGNVTAYLCPADTSSTSSFGVKFPRVRSVSMNAWLGPISPYSGSVMSYYKDSDLVQPGPAQLFVFCDENPYSINDGSIIFEAGLNDWIDCPASYHNHGGSLSFADGHAGIRRWTDQTVLTWGPPLIQPGNPNFTQLPPSQNPAVDLNFMQNASTCVK